MTVRYGRETFHFDKPMPVRSLLRELRIVSEGVVVAVNGELVTGDTLVRVGDDVEVIRAISGGSR